MIRTSKKIKLNFSLDFILFSLFLFGLGLLVITATNLFQSGKDLLTICTVLAICLIIPFIVFAWTEQYLKNRKKHKPIIENRHKYELLCKTGVLLEIDLNEESMIINNFPTIQQNNLRFIKQLMGFGLFGVFKSKQTEQDYCIVTIKYYIDQSRYYKSFTLPFNCENAEIILGIHGKANLYYDLTNHRNSILDLRFLHVHNLDYI